MFYPLYRLAALAAVLIPRVVALAPTDEWSDADLAQSGYLPNHNMDPAVVDSSQFGQLWKKPFNNLEKFYAKPLVYTPNAGGNQLLFLASSQNWIRTLDAKTGDLINARQVHAPFLQAEIGCTDIPNTIGIIGTPIIDPATDIVYFFSKTYIPNFRTAGNTGIYNGVYYFHGVDINTLQDVDGFPVLTDGSVADNDPRKYFIGGVVLQRPSLTKVGSVVYAGFGGHCDLFNYSGVVLGVDVNQKKVVANFVTEAGPLVPHTGVWNQNAGGGQGGIWMSGMAISTDGQRIFWVSGNGDGHQNDGSPASGSSGCQTLGEAVVNLNIAEGGKLVLQDYFQPFDYENMDGGDQDLGSGGIALLDPGTFKGTGVSKMAVTAGKNGKIYIMNANNLGGYKLGTAQTDGIVQTIETNKAVFGGVGSYPLEGGYIYSTPVGYPTYVYKLGFTGAGVPNFSPAGQTRETSAGRVGGGVPTITTYQGKAGTAILWMCDPDAGLRAWHAIPGADGFLKRINLPQVNGLNKFQRPAFGDTRLYVTDANGVLYCLGSPVNLPLNCTSPVDFGSVALGDQKTETVTCRAIIAIASVDRLTVGDLRFEVDDADLPTGPVAAGTSFSFPVTWNLEDENVQNAPNASYGNTAPGIKSTALTIFTTNAVNGYSTEFPISLTGVEVSQKAFLSLTPITVDFGGVVFLEGQQVPTITLPFVLSNAGLTPMTITGYGYTSDDLDGGDVEYTNATFTGGVADLGVGFTSEGLPLVGSEIGPGQSINVDTTFTPINGVGTYQAYFTVWSTGGSAFTILEGTASTAPVANFSISNGEGGWLPEGNLLMDFGTVAPGVSKSRQIRICSVGGSVLEISKSKPPNGVFRIDDPAELHESQIIPVGDCAYGTVVMQTNTQEPNLPDQVYTNSWTLNTDDLTWGVHDVQIKGTVIGKKVGPLDPSGNPQYQYLGCYSDANPYGRLLPVQSYVGDQNSNGKCQTECSAGNYIFAGTEYQLECYCGNTPPPVKYFDADDVYCTFSCAGDPSEACGGVGGYISVYYDPSKYTPGNDSSIVDTGPFTVNVSGNYDYLGCYSEGTNGRALGGWSPPTPAAGGSIDSCQAACQGYTYFGMEFANECYCGNTLNTGSVIQDSSDPTVNGCNMQCGGNASQFCGGPNRLNMYQINRDAPVPTQTPGGPRPNVPNVPTPTGGSVNLPSVGAYVYEGCYTDNVAGRALAAVQNPVTDEANTIEVCAAACDGFQYFGVEYGAECYCDDIIDNESTLAPGGANPAQNGCSMTCAGNASEWCGGPNRLSVYTLNPNVTSNGTTLPPKPAGPITVGDFDGWSYLGCYSKATNGRALSGLANPIPGTNVTVPACAAACSAYAYFGVEYSGECYCGGTINAGSARVTGTTPAQTRCNMKCTGDATTYCGGPNRLNMYENAGGAPSPTVTDVSTTSAASTPTGPITVEDLDGYSYLGCYNEVANARALSDLANPIPGQNVTIETCAAACSDYTYFGVEYSSECYCGNTIASGSAIVAGNTPADTGCNMLCANNATEYCGGGSRLNMYEKSATPQNRIAAAGTFRNDSSTLDAASGPASSTLNITSSNPSSNMTVTSEAVSSIMNVTSGTGSATMTVTLETVSSTTTATLESSSSITTNATTSLALAALAGPSSSLSEASSSSTTVSDSATANTTSMAITSSTTATTSTSVTESSTSLTETSNSVTESLATTDSTTSSAATSSFSSSMNSSTTVPSTTTTTTSSTTFSPTPGQTINAWAYLGCANETNPLALPAASYSSSDEMTVESCQKFCSSSRNNYGLAGLKYGGECYCANELQSYSAVGQTGCDMACTGNSSEICGGDSRLSVYNLTTFVPPTTVKAVGSYVSKGCYNELTDSRLLSGPTYTNTTDMTVESCVAFCKDSVPSQPYAGIEYGQECFCGSSLSSTASTVDISKCNMLCSGNNNELCGAPFLLNVYFDDPTTVSEEGELESMNAPNEATIKPNTTEPGEGTSTKMKNKLKRDRRARLNVKVKG